jgi:hypothetical protein
VRNAPAEAVASLPVRAPEFVVPSRGARCQVPGSRTLRGSGRLRGLAPLTSPLRSVCRCQQPFARVSHGLVSPSRSSRFRGWPPVWFTEVKNYRWGAVLPKQSGFPGLGPRIGCPVRGPSVRGPAASCRGVRSIPSWVVATRRPGITSVRFPCRCPRSLSGSESCEPFVVRGRTVAGQVPRGACLAGLHGVFDVKEHSRRQLLAVTTVVRSSLRTRHDAGSR